MQLGFEVGSGVVAIIRPLQSSSPVIRTHSFPVVVAEISDPSPKAPTDSQIAQNCCGHLLKLLTFHLFLNCQRISLVKPALSRTWLILTNLLNFAYCIDQNHGLKHHNLGANSLQNKNKLAKLGRHASRLHFASNSFGAPNTLHFRVLQALYTWLNMYNVACICVGIPFSNIFKSVIFGFEVSLSKQTFGLQHWCMRRGSKQATLPILCSHNLLSPTSLCSYSLLHFYYSIIVTTEIA